MTRLRLESVWYIAFDGRVIEGPFMYRDAALMRLASYPGAEVIRSTITHEEEA